MIIHLHSMQLELSPSIPEGPWNKPGWAMGHIHTALQARVQDDKMSQTVRSHHEM